MKCPRCEGTMVGEIIFYSNAYPLDINRCINCGEIIDPVILQNRINPFKNINFDILGRIIDNHLKY